MSFFSSLFRRNKSVPLDDSLRQRVEDIVARSYMDPYLGCNLIDAGAVVFIGRQRDLLTINIETSYPCRNVSGEMIEALSEGLAFLEEFSSIEIDVNWKIPAHKGQREEASRIKNIVAVSSGKGGVGKSTTTANLALALAKQGASVGILDADLYGPSQPLLMGIPEGTTPQTRDMRFYAPVVAHGIKVMSMGLMVSEKTPLMWRGPVASETIQQLIQQTLWGDMDYLLIDMPPGTGDVHITLSQSLSIAGAVVVTTPQDLALLDVRRGIDMFAKVDVPVIGVIENMSTHICSKCGKEEHIFGDHGGANMAVECDAELLGSMPLVMSIREQADAGMPVVLADPESDVALRYRDIALRMAVNVAHPDLITPLPNIRFVND
ncbi:hypothetical protein A9Q99_27525 [Gammaproteobacteria bacterium 45_16_T64]|nr:hypothetical protein A9Q99_27525 [Gammaproteobacteria bacterium 45_16_T64]